MTVRDKSTEPIIFDKEIHFTGEVCWCKPEYSHAEDTFFHRLDFDKGINTKKHNATC